MENIYESDLNESTTYQNMSDIAKSVLRDKFISLTA